MERGLANLVESGKRPPAWLQVARTLRTQMAQLSFPSGLALPTHPASQGLNERACSRLAPFGATSSRARDGHVDALQRAGLLIDEVNRRLEHALSTLVSDDIADATASAGAGRWGVADLWWRLVALRRKQSAKVSAETKTQIAAAKSIAKSGVRSFTELQTQCISGLQKLGKSLSDARCDMPCASSLTLQQQPRALSHLRLPSGTECMRSNVAPCSAVKHHDICPLFLPSTDCPAFGPSCFLASGPLPSCLL